MHAANLNTVTAKKQPSLIERFEKVLRDRKLPPKVGNEVSVDGKEVRTPSAGEFFGNLEKASEPERD
jgi:hypothetical protein